MLSSRSGGELSKNLKAMRVHRALAFLYCALAILFFSMLFFSSSETGSIVIGLPLIILVLGVVHGVVAYGAAKAASWARGSSIVIAGLMLLGFPIGTLIGIYLLANAQWDAPDETDKPPIKCPSCGKMTPSASLGCIWCNE